MELEVSKELIIDELLVSPVEEVALAWLDELLEDETTLLDDFVSLEELLRLELL